MAHTCVLATRTVSYSKERNYRATAAVATMARCRAADIACHLSGEHAHPVLSPTFAAPRQLGGSTLLVSEGVEMKHTPNSSFSRNIMCFPVDRARMSALQKHRGKDALSGRRQAASHVRIDKYGNSSPMIISSSTRPSFYIHELNAAHYNCGDGYRINAGRDQTIATCANKDMWLY